MNPRRHRLAAVLVVATISLPSLAVARPTRTLVLLDASASMRSNDPDRASVDAARLFEGLAETGDHVGVMTYGATPKVVKPLAPAGHGALDDLDVEFTDAKTDLEAALDGAYRRLAEHAAPGLDDVVVVLCDGGVELGMAATAAEKASVQRIERIVLQKLAARGIRVFTIALGSGADKRLLERIAKVTGGRAFEVAAAPALPSTFAEVAIDANGSETIAVRGGAFVVDTYEPTLTVLIPRGAAPTMLRTPTEVPIGAATHADHIRWISGGAYDLVTIEKADGGPWRIDGMSHDAPSFAVIRGGELRLRARVDDRQQLTAELLFEGRRSNSFKVHDRLRVVARVEAPDGTAREVDLARSPDGAYRGLVASGKAGRHRVRVFADGPSLSRERRTTFAAPLVVEPLVASVLTDDKRVSSVWPWLFGLALVSFLGAAVLLVLARRRSGRVHAAMAEELEAAKAQLEEIENRPPPAPPQPEWQVALLTAEDAKLLFPEEDTVTDSAMRAALEEAHQAVEALVEVQTGWQEMFQGLMQSALDVSNAIHKLQEEGESNTSADLELAAMTVHDEIGRLSDESAGLATAMEETVAMIAGLLSEADESRPKRRSTHNDINELIMARADGQTQKEFERLREEMLRSLRDDDDDVAALRGELAELKGNVEALEKERGWLEASLEEVTLEYEKVLDEFRT